MSWCCNPPNHCASSVPSRHIRGHKEVLNAVAFFNARGKTNTYGALQACREQIFTNANGDRTGVPNIAILVSDGDSNIEPLKTQEAAEELRNAQAEIFVVGVGPKPQSWGNKWNS